MCYGSVNKNPATLIYVTDRYKNQEMCGKEVKKGPWLLIKVILCLLKMYIYMLSVQDYFTCIQTTNDMKQPLELALSNRGENSDIKTYDLTLSSFIKEKN